MGVSPWMNAGAEIRKTVCKTCYGNMAGMRRVGAAKRNPPHKLRSNHTVSSNEPELILRHVSKQCSREGAAYGREKIAAEAAPAIL